MNKGQIIEIEIQDLGHTGEGIGKIDGLAVFIEGGLPGDKVRAKIDIVKKNYAVATLLDILMPSIDRVQAVCPISMECGGCQIMQMDYPKQLKLKETIAREALKRIGKIENPTINPAIGMTNPYNYRNKAQYPVGKNKQGKIITGFYRKRTHDIIPYDHCHVQDPVNETVLQTVREFMESEKIAAYDEKTGQGIIRHILTKTGHATGELMVVLVTNQSKKINSEKLVDSLKKKIPGFKTLVQNINQQKTNVVLGKKNITLYGEGIIRDKINDLIFEISPLSFYQVNPTQTKILYDKALEYAQIDKENVVIDLYCGIGTISLFLAKKAKKVYGIEIVEEAIQQAKKNAIINQIENTEFYAGKAEEILPKLHSEGIRADVVVVDPPRKGCEESVLQTIASIQPKRIVYVSCNPSTLARDLEIMGKLGYDFVEGTPVDMFPHTMHVECVIRLQKVK